MVGNPEVMTPLMLTSELPVIRSQSAASAEDISEIFEYQQDLEWGILPEPKADVVPLEL
jgi:hypothetical protein